MRFAFGPSNFFDGPFSSPTPRPVEILRNTFSDRTRRIAQLRPGSSFLLSVLRFLDRFNYLHPDTGAVHQVWYDDPASLKAKVRAANAVVKGLAGFGVWHLDALAYGPHATPQQQKDTAAMWDVFATGTAASSPSPSPSPISPSRTIAPGVVMPRISLGHPDHTSVNETAALELWLSAAVKGVGVDTAYGYDNQGQIGVALRASKRPRDSYFVTTKIPGTPGRAGALKYAKTDLTQMGLKQADLILIHSPCNYGFPPCIPSSDELIVDTWRGLEDALQQGLTRAIGVSNFDVNNLAPILAMKNATVPAINQCEMYVGNHDDATIEFCKQHDILYEAYSPLGRGKLNTSDPRIVKIAANHPGKSTFQVVLRWIVQQDCAMAVSSTKLSHDLSDLDLFDFELSAAEMQTLSSM